MIHNKWRRVVLLGKCVQLSVGCVSIPRARIDLRNTFLLSSIVSLRLVGSLVRTHRLASMLQSRIVYNEEMERRVVPWLTRLYSYTFDWISLFFNSNVMTKSYVYFLEYVRTKKKLWGRVCEKEFVDISRSDTWISIKQYSNYNEYEIIMKI